MVTVEMWRTRQLAALLTMLLCCVVPVLPGGAAGAQSKVAEHACCRRMKVTCPTPAQNSCCRAIPETPQVASLDAKTVERRPVVLIERTVSFVELLKPAVGGVWLTRVDRSPPQSPPRLTSNLRV